MDGFTALSVSHPARTAAEGASQPAGRVARRLALAAGVVDAP